MAKPHFKPLLLVWLVTMSALFGLSAVLTRYNQATPQVMQINGPSPIPVTENSATGISPDGKLKLTLKSEHQGNMTTWTLTAANLEAEPVTLLEKTVPDNITYSLPFNTISPDNRYLFIRETTSEATYYFIFKSDGSPVSAGKQMLEFAVPFAGKYPDMRLTEVTGWAGPTLIIINATDSVSGTAASYWFDLSSQSFIRLANRFN